MSRSRGSPRHLKTRATRTPFSCFCLKKSLCECLYGFGRSGKAKVEYIRKLDIDQAHLRRIAQTYLKVSSSLGARYQIIVFNRQHHEVFTYKARDLCIGTCVVFLSLTQREASSTDFVGLRALNNASRELSHELYFESTIPETRVGGGRESSKRRAAVAQNESTLSAAPLCK